MTPAHWLHVRGCVERISKDHLSAPPVEDFTTGCSGLKDAALLQSQSCTPDVLLCGPRKLTGVHPW